MTNKSIMVYLHLFHGRDTLEEDMEDWGVDGPVLGPFAYIHTTYGSDVKFAMELEAHRKAFPEYIRPSYHWNEATDCNLVESHLEVSEGCIKYGDKFYGDWSVATGTVHKVPEDVA